ncbi:hypothetical protein [Halosimplex halobium]|uniref:hypothetical protein n=1 Tax=Halosimplex halobium TaxID=3396618 RepID=UPI003F551077
MKRAIGILLVVCLSFLSGCPSNNGGQIGFIGSVNTTDSGFTITGKVSNTGYTDARHSDVSIYLMSSNGTVLISKELGTLSERSSLNVSVSTKEIPEYIIINSPSFWTYDQISVSYYEIENGGSTYVQEVIGSKDEFPVPVPPNSSTPG